jgi:hypothetical protein
MNIFVSTRPGDSKASGGGDVAVWSWASAEVARNVKRTKIQFDFISVEVGLGIGIGGAGAERYSLRDSWFRWWQPNTDEL